MAKTKIKKGYITLQDGRTMRVQKMNTMQYMIQHRWLYFLLLPGALYFILFRYNPDLRKEGKNPFILDSKEPEGDFRQFLRGEVRFSALERTFPQEADALFEKTEKEAKARYAKYKALAQ